MSDEDEDYEDYEDEDSEPSGPIEPKRVSLTCEGCRRRDHCGRCACCGLDEESFRKERQGEWTEPRLKRCAHSRRFPTGNDREDQCNNVAEFSVEGEPVCGQCLAPVVKMILRRQPAVRIESSLR